MFASPKDASFQSRMERRDCACGSPRDPPTITHANQTAETRSTLGGGPSGQEGSPFFAIPLTWWQNQDMSKAYPRWTRAAPRDGIWWHRSDARSAPILLYVWGGGVYYPLEGEVYLLRDFGGLWWSAPIVPPRAALAYLRPTGKAAGTRKRSRS